MTDTVRVQETARPCCSPMKPPQLPRLQPIERTCSSRPPNSMTMPSSLQRCSAWPTVAISKVLLRCIQTREHFQLPTSICRSAHPIDVFKDEIELATTTECLTHLDNIFLLQRPQQTQFAQCRPLNIIIVYHWNRNRQVTTVSK